MITALLGVSLNLVHSKFLLHESLYSRAIVLYQIPWLNIFKTFITVDNQGFMLPDKQVASMIRQLQF